jgi:hypothetical protein
MLAMGLDHRYRGDQQNAELVEGRAKLMAFYEPGLYRLG